MGQSFIEALSCDRLRLFLADERAADLVDALYLDSSLDTDAQVLLCRPVALQLGTNGCKSLLVLIQVNIPWSEKLLEPVSVVKYLVCIVRGEDAVLLLEQERHSLT